MPSVVFTAAQASLILDTEPSPALAWMQHQWREITDEIRFGEPYVDEETGETIWAHRLLTDLDEYLGEVAAAGAEWVLTDPEERSDLVPYQAQLDWELMQGLTPEERDAALADAFSQQATSLGLPTFGAWREAKYAVPEELA